MCSAFVLFDKRRKTSTEPWSKTKNKWKNKQSNLSLTDSVPEMLEMLRAALQ